MSSKYLPPTEPAIITNDLFLAAFLHCVGCTFDHVERNGRRRVSFVFVGERVRELREAYRTQKVMLDMNAFRGSMHEMRRQMDLALSECSAINPPYERSVPHVHQSRETSFETVPQC
jgi:hypothetical protein